MAYISFYMDLESVANRVAQCGEDEVAEFLDALAESVDERFQVKISQGTVDLQTDTIVWLRSVLKAVDSASS